MKFEAIMFALILSIGALEADKAFSQGPSLLIPQPGPGNIVVPLFNKPFTGDIRLSNFMDHNVPQEGVDSNGIQINYWGESTRFLDGHSGYDLPMPEGTPIYAAADGQVTTAGALAPFACFLLNNQIVTPVQIRILHQAPNGERIRSLYAHLSRVDVEVGDFVQAGKQIGLSGNTGCSTAPHLHFEARRLDNTNSGQETTIDPYGWEGPGPDPWAQNSQGAESLWLWKPGQAPALFREVDLAPNPSGSSAPVALTALRWMGWKDDDHPNNEFVEFTLDTRFAPSGAMNMTGFILRNNRQKEFKFPYGFQIHVGSPVRVYTGPGVNTQTELYWGLSHGVWDDMGDCAHLAYPGDGEYRLGSGVGCTYVPPPVIGCPASSLQFAIDNALPGETISASGTCTENIVIRNEKQRFTLDGSGAGAGTRATINGAAGSPAVNVRGKGILIQNFTITGGSNGVEVNRGSNAVINGNVIQNTGGDGVIVDQLSFAVITSNAIQNNPGTGILVDDGSTARIGFNQDTETTASPNTIQNNALGVVVSNGSSARIIGNTIQNNSADGLFVTRDSQSDIANNTINGNGGDGIKLGDGAVIQLGEDSGTSVYESPNTTTSANTGFGIRCTDGGIANGRRGPLTGTSGTASFDSSCADGLAP